MIEDDELLDLAAAVADGEAVQFQAMQSPAPEDRSAWRQLELISQIARVHRQVSVEDSFAAATESEVPISTPPAGDGGRWGELQVLEKLGSGSFGDVHRAWDPALDREVALKLLRSDRGSVQTVSEGQMLARVRHPNVMAIYGAAEVSGRIGIWGELLRGRTLATMVGNDGPLGAGEALIVADALCRALAAVHRAGLLHRDVKAENVIRETGGRIVLMDFGLGRPIAATSGAGSAGTPAYLAPEIFAGSPASVKTDIYAVGVLLFYLSTGEYPVVAASIEGLAKAQKEGRRQKLQDLRPELPAGFVQLVERALAADPEHRFASAGAMLEAVTVARDTAVVPETRPGPGVATIAGWMVLAAVVAAAIPLWFWPAPPAVMPRLVAVEPPVGTRFTDSTRNVPAISPDGSMLAFSATDETSGRIYLWIHSLQSATAVRIPDSERALTPFWAPDGRRLGFFEPGGTITWVTTEGTKEGSLKASAEPRGATWNATGTLLYPRGPRSGLYALSTTDPGSTERLILKLDRDRGELGHLWPQFLDDGQRFVFFVLSNDPSVRGVYLGSLDGAIRLRLAASDSSAVVSNRRLLFVKEGNLVSQPLAADHARAEGPSTVVAEQVAVNYDARSAVTADRSGSIAFLPSRENTELVWLSATGQPGGKLAVPPARYRSPVVSRDGRLVAVQLYRDGLSEIQVFETETGRPRSAVAHSAEVQFPVWGPGSLLAYSSIDTGVSAIYVKDFASDAPPRLTYSGRSDAMGADLMPTDWSPDGRHLVAVESAPGRPFALWAVPLNGVDAPFAIRPGEGTQVSGRFSPDGQSLVYVRRPLPTRTGDPPDREIWSCDFPSGAHPRLLATAGIDPAWPSNGSVSFFDRTGEFTILPIDGTGKPVTFRPGVNTPEASRNSYAWVAGGERLIVNKPLHNPASNRIMVRFDRY